MRRSPKGWCSSAQASAQRHVLHRPSSSFVTTPARMQSLAALSHPLLLFIGISVCESDVRGDTEADSLKGSNWPKVAAEAAVGPSLQPAAHIVPHALCYPRAPNPGPLNPGP